VESIVQHDKAISKLAYKILSLCGVHCCLAKGQSPTTLAHMLLHATCGNWFSTASLHQLQEH
jgi:hypothetical protein